MVHELFPSLHQSKSKLCYENIDFNRYLIIRFYKHIGMYQEISIEILTQIMVK